MQETILKPLIEQRADPYIYKHTDGYYYFTASVPLYDRIELRRATTIDGLATAQTVDAWTKPANGPYSELVWAPELHFNQGAWYVYFAADAFNPRQHHVTAYPCARMSSLTVL